MEHLKYDGRKVMMKDGSRGFLIGIFQYGSMMDETGTEPLAVIEMEDGSIRDAVSLSGFQIYGFDEGKIFESTSSLPNLSGR